MNSLKLTFSRVTAQQGEGAQCLLALNRFVSLAACMVLVLSAPASHVYAQSTASDPTSTEPMKPTAPENASEAGSSADAPQSDKTANPGETKKSPKLPAAPGVKSGLMMPSSTAKAGANPAAHTSTPPTRKHVSPYSGMKLTEKAKEYYPAAWGVDRLRVNYTSSGNLIRFSYRVVQPTLAKALADHQSAPALYAPRSHAMLQIPTMEKVGQLRQFAGNEPDKEYWMVFSNKGNLVRPGERVNVIIGKFHADGLLVE
jgi:hypothetical protein